MSIPLQKLSAQVSDASDSYREPAVSVQEQFSRQLEGLLEISNIVGSKMELHDILSQITLLSARIFNTPDCAIYLLDKSRKYLVLEASISAKPDQIGAVKISVGEGLAGYAAQTNQMVTVSDLSKNSRYIPLVSADHEIYRSLICAPLRMQEEVIGVMSARRFDIHEFAPEERTLFETVCKQVAIVIEKSKMYYAKVEADKLAAISISLSEIAHYIKNLLQGMKGGMYFVDLGLKRGEIDMAAKGWEVLQRGNKKIAGLVENMLNYSREMKLNFQRHNINSIIYDILQQVDDSTVNRGVALVPETYRDLPSVEVDYDRMYDALLNLISNAVDAIPADKDDGLVIIRSRLSVDSNYVEVDVEDNGCGMSPEIQARLFNLFFSTKGERGSGIGLAVTRKIVDEHGGQILVKSAEGQGTTFTVRIPVKRREKG